MATRPRSKAVFAVLTGDLVRSTELAPAQLAHARALLGDASAEIASWAPNAVAAPVEFFRGDSWQLALGEARFFLRAAIYVRARLRAANIQFDTRLGVGLGRAEQIDPARTSLSIGEAFLISGRTLDRPGIAGGIAIGVPVPLSGYLGWLDPMAGLCSALADRWTERQSEIVWRMLMPVKGSQKALAADLNIAPQTVNKALAGADFRALASAIDFVEAISWADVINRPKFNLL